MVGEEQGEPVLGSLSRIWTFALPASQDDNRLDISLI